MGVHDSNHNFMAANICICMYNFSYLVEGVGVEELSRRIRRVGVALFIVLIRKSIAM